MCFVSLIFGDDIVDKTGLFKHEIAYRTGVDLWNTKVPNGNNLRNCIEYFKHLYNNPFLWKYTWIKPDGCFGTALTIKLSALRYSDAELCEINKLKRESVMPNSNISFTGILELI